MIQDCQKTDYPVNHFETACSDPILTKSRSRWNYTDSSTWVSRLFTFSACFSLQIGTQVEACLEPMCIKSKKQMIHLYLQIVFSEHTWIGTKEENPEELPLPMPSTIPIAPEGHNLILASLYCMICMPPKIIESNHLQYKLDSMCCTYIGCVCLMSTEDMCM